MNASGPVKDMNPDVDHEDKQVLISVIVAAHDRKEYLKGAIDSVLNQSLSRDEYEIIVVKNYKDNDIDSFLDSNGIKSTFSDKEPVLMKYYEAMKFASGRIISFLDDDDLFHPGKLKAVKEIFEKHKVVYHHNGYLSNLDKFKKTDLHAPGTVLIHDQNDSSSTSMYDLTRHSPSANASAISISRDAIEFSKKLENNITRNVDVFFFLTALEMEKPVSIDLRPLTFYRIHREGMSRPTYPLKVAEHAVDSLGTIERELKKFKNPEAVQFLKDLKKRVQFRHAIVTRPSRNIVLKRARGLVFGTRIHLSRRYKATILFITFLSMFSRGLGAWAFCYIIL